MLADKMGITVDKCHIGMFNLDQCRQVIDICKVRMNEKEITGSRD
jgi:hypothetical protein